MGLIACTYGELDRQFFRERYKATTQSSYEFPPEWGLVPPNPDPDLVLSGDAIEKEMDRIEMPSLDVPISRIIGSTPLAFRPDVEIPELSEIDSETDEQPGTPPDAGASFAGWNRTVKSDSPPVQRVTVIGGAVVRNLCLAIPDEDMNGFADLPVQPIRASKGQPAQRVAKILDDETEKPPMPFLIIPDEHRGGSDIKSADSTAMNLYETWSSSLYSPGKPTSGPIPWALTALKAGGALEEKKDEESEKEKLGRSKMDEFVLSGDINDFWGIKGLTAKLYKYKGPEKDVDDVPEEPEDKEDKSQDDTEEPSGKMVPLSTEPDTKPSDDKDDKDIKEEDSEEHDKDEPAREKIKLNTESFSLKGQPLGTLFPSINDFNLKNLPVENLEFTYSEEKKNFLFKPGLRLEVDVLFTNSLAWAGDALRKLFGPTDPPKSIHLSFFPPLALKAWDLLNFRTLGIEITATKATKNKPSKEKPEGDKHEDRKPKGETDGDHDTGSGETETTKLSKFRATEQSPDQDGEVAEKSLVKSSDKSSAKTPSEKKEKDHKTKKVKRGSRFGIIGVVEINKVAIKVGLYTEQKKDKKKREWLAFGTIENVRLREIWNDIPEDNFLNLELRNIALIASSHERKKKKKDDKKEDEDGNEKKKKTDGDKEKSDEVKPKAITNEVSDGEIWINSLDVLKVAEEEKPDKDLKEEEEKEPDNWDVLGTVDAYNYPVVKGLQLCATIPSFPQLEELNGKKKLEVLTLVSSITSNDKIIATFGYCIPPQLRYYYRHQVVYGARVEHPRNITFQSKLYLFHHGIPQEKLRYNVFNGRTWEGDTDIHIDDVTVGFTAVVFNDKIYLFYLPRYGFSSHRYAYVAFDGRRWEKAHTLARYATSGVTAAVYQNKLYLMHRGYGETDVKKLWYNVFDGKRWITLS
ncbi:hypothetical protein NW758_009422 [Fusarium oxysporum]|nr:hypothetical protein NW758_009422 [Fusarium oxysporum]